MARFIITGNYTAEAMRGMISHPSDREGATRKLVEATGGTLDGFYLTSGETDFLMIVSVDDSAKIVPALMVAGASGATSGLKTVRAYSSAEFLGMQKAAASLAASYAPPA